MPNMSAGPVARLYPLEESFEEGLHAVTPLRPSNASNALRSARQGLFLEPTSSTPSTLHVKRRNGNYAFSSEAKTGASHWTTETPKTISSSARDRKVSPGRSWSDESTLVDSLDFGQSPTIHDGYQPRGDEKFIGKDSANFQVSPNSNPLQAL